MKYNILLVEDNVAITKSIILTLENEQFHVIPCYDGKSAYEKIATFNYDLVLLDLVLPDANGEEILQMIRKKSTVPVIIISMKSSDIEKAINLGLGADDFLTKPFSMIELVARVKAAIRRTKYFESPSQAYIYRFDAFEMDLHNFTLKRNNELVTLTNKEFEILKTLVVGHFKVFSKKDLYRHVWNDVEYENDNVINVHVNRLRAKLGDNNDHPNIVKTVWGFGYKIGVEVSQIEKIS